MGAKEKVRIGVRLTLDGVSLLDCARTKANDGLGLSRSEFIEVVLRRAAQKGWLDE